MSVRSLLSSVASGETDFIVAQWAILAALKEDKFDPNDAALMSCLDEFQKIGIRAAQKPGINAARILATIIRSHLESRDIFSPSQGCACCDEMDFYSSLLYTLATVIFRDPDKKDAAYKAKRLLEEA